MTWGAGATSPRTAPSGHQGSEMGTLLQPQGLSLPTSQVFFIGPGWHLSEESQHRARKYPSQLSPSFLVLKWWREGRWKNKGGSAKALSPALPHPHPHHVARPQTTQQEECLGEPIFHPHSSNPGNQPLASLRGHLEAMKVPFGRFPVCGFPRKETSLGHQGPHKGLQLSSHKGRRHRKKIQSFYSPLSVCGA